jgi:hypothetical protein
VSTLAGVGWAWKVSPVAGSGTINLATLTAKAASGTFSFTAPANANGATGTKVVTNGAFNVTLP